MRTTRSALPRRSAVWLWTPAEIDTKSDDVQYVMDIQWRARCFFFLEEFTLSVTYDEAQLLPSLCQLDKSEMSWLKLGSDADEDLLSHILLSQILSAIFCLVKE